MTEDEMKTQIEYAQDMVNSLIEQRNASDNMVVQLRADGKQKDRRITALDQRVAALEEEVRTLRQAAEAINSAPVPNGHAADGVTAH